MNKNGSSRKSGISKKKSTHFVDAYGVAVYTLLMHGVIETPTYRSDAKAAGLSEEDQAEIAFKVAQAPLAGALIPGTGGARKRRFPAPNSGKGKSGGYRVITYFVTDDVPVFLLALVDKGQRADISQAERNDLRVKMPVLVESYRASVRAKAKSIRR